MLRYHAKNKKIDFKRVVTTLGTENNEGLYSEVLPFVVYMC